MSELPAYVHRTHPRARRITLKVESDGSLVVVTPKRFSQKAVEQFVLDNTSWIAATREKMSSKKASEYGETAESLHVFGKRYTKKIINQAGAPPGLHIQGSQAVINTHAAPAATLIERFLKNTAEEYIRPRTHQLAEKMGISFNNLTLRQQKTRWGSCSSRGNLNFNWRLVHVPPPIIDYVIIHELAHRQHMNHSARFWALVAEYDPQYQEHRQWLHRHGMSLG